MSSRIEVFGRSENGRLKRVKIPVLVLVIKGPEDTSFLRIGESELARSSDMLCGFVLLFI